MNISLLTDSFRIIFALNILSRGSYAIMNRPIPHIMGTGQTSTRSDRSRGHSKKGYQINTESVINQVGQVDLAERTTVLPTDNFRNYHLQTLLFQFDLNFISLCY